MAAFLLTATLHPTGKHESRKETTMTLTINSPKSNFWKRIKAQYIALTAGLALAVSGGAVIVNSQDRDTAAPAGSAAANTAPVASRSQPPEFVYYVVGSEADRTVLLSAIHSEIQAGHLSGPSSVNEVLVAGTTEERLMSTDGHQERAANGVAVRRIDLTLDDNVLPWIESTERITYFLP
jgi:hypothetical protein